MRVSSHLSIDPSPPLPLGKESLFTFEQPRWAPSLAGFFTFSCGLGVPPFRPTSRSSGPFPLSVLYCLRTRRVTSPQDQPVANQGFSENLEQAIFPSIAQANLGTMEFLRVCTNRLKRVHRKTTTCTTVKAQAQVRSGALGKALEFEGIKLFPALGTLVPAMYFQCTWCASINFGWSRGTWE